ncbi:hypothetical protein [Domibacillus tundrae]|uniref:hypothetical protein n=1 Tax=Domibacillus tundrae TaxID=1587527 RepID=UPI003392F40E
MKKQSKAIVYLSVSLLVAIVFSLLLLNQFFTNDPAPALEKQRVTTEPKTAAPKEEKEPASQTEKKSEKESEGKAETEENQNGYVADWFKQSESPENEEVPVSSEDEATDNREAEKTNKEATEPNNNEPNEGTIENQSNKEVIEKQPVEAPIPPTQPEQPSFSSDI